MVFHYTLLISFETSSYKFGLFALLETKKHAYNDIEVIIIYVIFPKINHRSYSNHKFFTINLKIYIIN